MGLQTFPPFPSYFDAEGAPLENGYVYIGAANQNPQTNPIAVYWDADLTIPAAQPIRTSAGYTVRNGTPANLFVGVEYSMVVRDRNSVLVYSCPVAPASLIIGPGGAGLVGFSQAEDYPASTVGARLKQAVSVKDEPFGAVGDMTTDDTAAIQAAYTFAKAAGRALYFPGCEAGKGYKMTQTLVIDLDCFTVYGDGPSSMLVAYNDIGDPAIRVEADHVSIRDLGITGIEDSGHGLQLGVTGGANAYYGTYENLWISWMGGNCIDAQRAQSSVFTNVNMDHETITAPVTLPVGVSKGQRTNGVNVRLASAPNNNDLTFLGCIVNAACDPATGWEVQVGAQGTGGFTTLYWIGGLIQSYDGLIRVIGGATHCYFTQVYVEPSVSPGLINIADGQFIVFEKMILDARLDFSASTNCAVRDVVCDAITIGATSTNFVLEHCSPGSAGGTITDNSNQAVIRNVAGGARSGFGPRFPGPVARYFGSNFDEWLGGGSPTVPSGFANQGATIAREASTKRLGSYSMKVTVGGVSFSSGARVDIPDDVIALGVDIVVDVWLYVTAGDIGAVSLITNAGTADISVTTTGSWVRRVLRFNGLVGTDTSGYLLFGGDAGAIVYFDVVDIYIDGYVAPTTKTLADSATPNIGVVPNGGPQIQHATTNAANTTITGFTNVQVGIPFWLTLGGAIDFTDSAGLQLAGGANFTTGVAGDVIGFVYGADGVTREIGRSIN